MLNDKQISELVETNELITPYSLDQLQPHSYDAKLGKTLLVPHVYKITQIGMNPPEYECGWEEKNVEEYVLPHLGFALATTEEYLKLPQDVVGFVCGKSTIGRNGLQIENAGLIDAGFEGQITLELFNMAPWPIHFKAGMPICQIYFIKADSPEHKDYAKLGHYNGQKGPTKPRYTL